jgi:hypothetical protein
LLPEKLVDEIGRPVWRAQQAREALVPAGA